VLKCSSKEQKQIYNISQHHQRQRRSPLSQSATFGIAIAAGMDSAAGVAVAVDVAAASVDNVTGSAVAVALPVGMPAGTWVACWSRAERIGLVAGDRTSAGQEQPREMFPDHHHTQVAPGHWGIHRVAVAVQAVLGERTLARHEERTY
jgi:hypothetical protein